MPPYATKALSDLVFQTFPSFQISLVHLTSAQRYNAGSNSVSGPDLWQTERPADMAKIVDLEVMCGKEHMEVQVSFDRPFNGIIFSKVRISKS